MSRVEAHALNPALTHYAIQRNADGNVYNGAAWVAFASANWTTYATGASVPDASGYWSTTPAAGTASYDIYVRVGAAPSLAADYVVWSDVYRGDIDNTLAVMSGVLQDLGVRAEEQGDKLDQLALALNAASSEIDAISDRTPAGWQGSVPVTVKVVDASGAAVGGAFVDVVGVGAGALDGTGIAHIGVPAAGTYTFRAAAGGGLLFADVIQAVSATAPNTVTLTGSAVAFAAPVDPAGCVCRGVTRDTTRARQSGVKVSFAIVSAPGGIYRGNPTVVESDVNALVTIELPQGATVVYWRGVRPLKPTSFVVPAATQYTLPDIVGHDQ